MKLLFEKYLDNQCSPEELKQLLAHFNNPSDEQVLKELIRESLAADNESIVFDEKQRSQATEESYLVIKTHIDAERGKVIPFHQKTWFRVAASVVILFSALAIFFLNKPLQKGMVEVKQENKYKNDIAPGGNKAVLTLADNTQIILDSVSNGDLSKQGNVKIIKLDGQLTYNTSGMSTQVLYNTITTPRGGQYQLILADGSKVWLNAASSLRFPTNFVGKERKVELTGEGYFEVARNTSMPFKVNIAGKGEVEVLGTHFNINSYGDEASINTTLLEGKVRVTEFAGKSSQLLIPGQQAQFSTGSTISINKDIDVEKVVAWKNGKFIFYDEDIRSVMRQLEKWYDLEVKYSGNVTKDLFVGVVSRNVNISQILTMLEKTGGVDFEIWGKTIIVK